MESAWCIPSATLVLIGGINWGLVGLGMLLGKDLNVVHLILGGLPVWVEAVVYLLVGLMALKVVAFALLGKKCC